MRFPPVRRPGSIVLRLCVLAIAIAGIGATSKVFVDVLRYPTQVHDAREALQRANTDEQERVDALVVLQRDVLKSLEAIRSAARDPGLAGDSARGALANIEKAAR